jgi:hypothetical protein
MQDTASHHTDEFPALLARLPADLDLDQLAIEQRWCMDRMFGGGAGWGRRLPSVLIPDALEKPDRAPEAMVVPSPLRGGVDIEWQCYQIFARELVKKAAWKHRRQDRRPPGG